GTHSRRGEFKPSRTHGPRSRPGPKRSAPNLVDPNRKVMIKHAAARRATRRLPLGEPPLVITTHAITSFRSSLPEPAGDQPRAGSGSSPSRRRATRKSADVCVMSRPTKLLYPPTASGSTGQPEKTSGGKTAGRGDGRLGRPGAGELLHLPAQGAGVGRLRDPGQLVRPVNEVAGESRPNRRDQGDKGPGGHRQGTRGT